MRRLIKVLLVSIFAIVALLAAGIVFTGQHFCIGNTTLCFSSE